MQSESAEESMKQDAQTLGCHSAPNAFKLLTLIQNSAPSTLSASSALKQLAMEKCVIVPDSMISPLASKAHSQRQIKETNSDKQIPEINFNKPTQVTNSNHSTKPTGSNNLQSRQHNTQQLLHCLHPKAGLFCR